MSKGIDIPIEELISKFTSNLWTGFDTIYRGRIQRNERDGDVIPEWFNPDTNEYEDILLNDKVDATVFVDVQPEEDYTSRFSANVAICFAINIKTLYPSVTERATEYAHADAMSVIKKTKFKPNKLIRGLDAFKDYKLVKQTDNMNQFYLFKIEATIVYPQNC